MSESDRPAPEARIAGLRRLARLLDSSIRLPGGFTIGLDGIIGLIPGVGDLIGAALSSWIVAAAVRMKLPPSVVLRMGMNVAVELLVGAIPLVGDLFDFVFKANERNVALIERHLAEPGPSLVRSRLAIAGVLLALAGLLGAVLAALVGLVVLIRGVLAA